MAQQVGARAGPRQHQAEPTFVEPSPGLWTSHSHATPLIQPLDGARRRLSDSSQDAAIHDTASLWGGSSNGKAAPASVWGTEGLSQSPFSTQVPLVDSLSESPYDFEAARERLRRNSNLTDPLGGGGLVPGMGGPAGKDASSHLLRSGSFSGSFYPYLNGAAAANTSASRSTTSATGSPVTNPHYNYLRTTNLPGSPRFFGPTAQSSNILDRFSQVADQTRDQELYASFSRLNMASPEGSGRPEVQSPGSVMTYRTDYSPYVSPSPIHSTFDKSRSNSTSSLYLNTHYGPGQSIPSLGSPDQSTVGSRHVPIQPVQPVVGSQPRPASVQAPSPLYGQTQYTSQPILSPRATAMGLALANQEPRPDPIQIASQAQVPAQVPTQIPLPPPAQPLLQPTTSHGQPQTSTKPHQNQSQPSQPQSHRGPIGQGQTKRGKHAPRSPLLEEFRANKTRKFELQDLSGHVVEFSTDQHGSRFIQQKLETASLDQKQAVFGEIETSSLQLMTDVFGNYVIQKYFELGSRGHKTALVAQMRSHILELSLQMYGCRVVQKAIEHVMPDEQVAIVAELDGHVLKCIKDQNGNHVIQKAIERIASDRISFMLTAFDRQISELATHPYGCRVIQRMLEHSDPQSREALLKELHSYMFYLVEDQYGNYVIQHVVERGQPEDRDKIIELVLASIVEFSRHKYASNVVEKCIMCATPSQQGAFVETITTTRADGTQPVAVMMRDQYANYVVQKLLDITAGPVHDQLVTAIRPQLQALKKYAFGKQLSGIERHLVQ